MDVPVRTLLSLSPAVAEAAAGLGRAGAAQGLHCCTPIIAMSWTSSLAALPELLVNVLTCKVVPISGVNMRVLWVAVGL